MLDNTPNTRKPSPDAGSVFIEAAPGLHLSPAEIQEIEKIKPHSVSKFLNLTTHNVLSLREKFVCFRNDDLISVLCAIDRGYFILDDSSFMKKEHAGRFYTTANPESLDLLDSGIFSEIKWGTDEEKWQGNAPSLDAVINRNNSQYENLAVSRAIVRNVWSLLSPKFEEMTNFKLSDKMEVEEFIDKLSDNIINYADKIEDIRRTHAYTLRRVRNSLAPGDYELFKDFAKKVHTRGNIFVAFDKEILLYGPSAVDTDDLNEITFGPANKRIPVSSIIGIEPLGEHEDFLIEYLKNKAKGL